MTRKFDGGMIAGVILVLVGLLALFRNWLPFDAAQFFTTYLFLILGLALIAAGIYTREPGWFIPGGILTGLGAGFAFLVGPLAGLVADEAAAGAFMLGLAGGFALITVLSLLFSHTHYWWALIPAAVVGLVGLAVGYGGVFWRATMWLQWLWPIALIVLGGFVLWRTRHPRPASDESKPIEKHT